MTRTLQQFTGKHWYLLEVLQGEVGDGISVGLARHEELVEGGGPLRPVCGAHYFRAGGVRQVVAHGADAATLAVTLAGDLQGKQTMWELTHRETMLDVNAQWYTKV